MSKFLSRSEFKWIDPKEFDLKKYTTNSSKRCILEVDLELRSKKLIQKNYENYTMIIL